MSIIHGDAQVSRAMITVHGAGNWPIGYAQPMLQAIQGSLSPQIQQLDVLEVNYSDVIMSAAAQVARTTTAASANTFMNALATEHVQSAMGALSPSSYCKISSAHHSWLGLPLPCFFLGRK